MLRGCNFFYGVNFSLNRNPTLNRNPLIPIRITITITIRRGLAPRSCNCTHAQVECKIRVDVDMIKDYLPLEAHLSRMNKNKHLYLSNQAGDFHVIRTFIPGKACRALQNRDERSRLKHD